MAAANNPNTVMFRRSGGHQRRAVVAKSNSKVCTQLVYLEKTRAWRQELAKFEQFKALIREVRRAGGGPRNPRIVQYQRRMLAELADKVEACKRYRSQSCRQANNYRMYHSLYQGWHKVCNDPNAFVTEVELYTANGKVL